MLPYLDLNGFKLRTVMPSGDVGVVEAAQPGFTAVRIGVQQSYINARLRKRYGNALPLGQNPPALVAVGNLPPGVQLGGRPVLGSYQFQIQVTTAGNQYPGTFQWSSDNGVTWLTGVAGASSVALGLTGVSAAFPTGAYTTGQAWYASTPVPETVLGWIVALVTVDLYRKRGVNPQDPTITMVREDAIRALDELKEAADSNAGLFDLPVADDQGSNINTGGPLGYSETSPYVWTDKEAGRGRQEDSENGPGSQNGGQIV